MPQKHINLTSGKHTIAFMGGEFTYDEGSAELSPDDPIRVACMIVNDANMDLKLELTHQGCLITTSSSVEKEVGPKTFAIHKQNQDMVFATNVPQNDEISPQYTAIPPERGFGGIVMDTMCCSMHKVLVFHNNIEALRADGYVSITIRHKLEGAQEAIHCQVFDERDFVSDDERLLFEVTQPLGQSATEFDVLDLEYAAHS